MATTSQSLQDRAPQTPTLRALFALFCKVGLTSFGGGTSIWLYHQIVNVKGWMDKDEFFDVWALCQALPGVNVTNLAVWIGNRFQGWKGVVSALAGMILLPSILIIGIALLFGMVAQFPATAILLTGATAAAIALPFSMGITLALRLRRAATPMALMVSSFVAVAFSRSRWDG